MFLLVENDDNINKIKTLFEDNSVLRPTSEERRNNQLAFLDVLLKQQEFIITTSINASPTDDGDCMN